MTEEELKYFYSDFKKIRQSKNISIDDIIHKSSFLVSNTIIFSLLM